MPKTLSLLSTRDDEQRTIEDEKSLHPLEISIIKNRVEKKTSAIFLRRQFERRYAVEIAN